MFGRKKGLMPLLALSLLLASCHSVPSELAPEPARTPSASRSPSRSEDPPTVSVDDSLSDAARRAGIPFELGEDFFGCHVQISDDLVLGEGQGLLSLRGNLLRYFRLDVEPRREFEAPVSFGVISLAEPEKYAAAERERGEDWGLEDTLRVARGLARVNAGSDLRSSILDDERDLWLVLVPCARPHSWKLVVGDHSTVDARDLLAELARHGKHVALLSYPLDEHEITAEYDDFRAAVAIASRLSSGPSPLHGEDLLARLGDGLAAEQNQNLDLRAVLTARSGGVPWIVHARVQLPGTTREGTTGHGDASRRFRRELWPPSLFDDPTEKIVVGEGSSPPYRAPPVTSEKWTGTVASSGLAPRPSPPNETLAMFALLSTRPRFSGLAGALLLSLSTGSALAQELDEKQALARFGKEFRQNPKKPRPVEERSAALELLEGHESAKVASTLAEAYTDVEKELLALDEERQEVSTQLSSMVKGMETATRTFNNATMATYKQLGERATELAAQTEELRRLLGQVASQIEELHEPEVVVDLMEDVFKDKKAPHSLKLIVARTAGRVGEPAVESLRRAMRRAKKAEPLILILASLEELAEDASALAPAVASMLEHDSVSVRLRAASTLSKMASPAGIEPLILRLSEEEGPVLKRMAGALEVLTGMSLGTSIASWVQWLQTEGDRYIRGDVTLGQGRSRLLESGADKGGYYHGIPQDGLSIVYVLDCSGSMVVSMKNPLYKGKVAVPALGGEDPSRAEACQQELIKALGQLPRGTKFNVIYFNDLAYPYSGKMVVASKKTVPAVQTWVDELGALQSTNIHDALEMAFGFAGRGVFDKHYEAAVDTIFLLTDGTPTNPDGSMASRERIHEATKRWNPDKTVTIHCIGVGRGVDVSFLTKLANQNGGRFVQR